MMRSSMLIVTTAALGMMLPACSRKQQENAPAPFDCALLQQRAETCAPQTLARVKADLADRKDHEQQFKMFESRFNTKLAAKKTKAQCEKFQADKARTERVDSMKTCYSEPDCDAFAACMMKL